MASPNEGTNDLFLPSGGLRPDRVDPSTSGVLQETLRLARATHWDSIRSPHVFMGLLAAPDASVNDWGERLGADLPMLLDQFRELFQQEDGSDDGPLVLNREFFSDNVIRLLRDALARAGEHQRSRITPMDLLISILTAQNSIVAECFERIGVTAAKLTELAVIAELRGNEVPPPPQGQSADR
jgi:ATP-dependent Clp protease ATP-binding subunit ClpA